MTFISMENRCLVQLNGLTIWIVVVVFSTQIIEMSIEAADPYQ